MTMLVRKGMRNGVVGMVGVGSGVVLLVGARWGGKRKKDELKEEAEEQQVWGSSD